MIQEHDTIMTESQMMELVDICTEYREVNPPTYDEFMKMLDNTSFEETWIHFATRK